MPKNYYIILGIPADSTQDEIKAAYRRLVKEFHPDHFGENYSPFLVIQEAYSVLSDPGRRRTYDSSLQKHQKRPISARSIRPKRGYPGEEIEPMVPEPGAPGLRADLLKRSFNEYWPSFDGLFERLSRDCPGRQTRKERPENLTFTVTLSPEQAVTGGNIRLYVPVKMQCPGCGGRGGTGLYQCWQCSGAGSFTGEYPIIIGYPPGIRDNHTVQVSLDRYGKGDLFLTVRFRTGDLM